jgi:hypothetical protein
MKSAEDRKQAEPWFLLGLFFESENGGDIFRRNAGSFLPDYTVLYIFM